VCYIIFLFFISVADLFNVNSGCCVNIDELLYGILLSTIKGSVQRKIRWVRNSFMSFMLQFSLRSRAKQDK
jgi:hypothetical protein